MHILVAVDFSDAGVAVLSQARQYARLLRASLWLVHVADPEPDFVGYRPGPQSVRDQVAHEQRDEHKKLQSLAEQFRQEGLQATALLVQGYASQSLLQEADKLAADLIIVGSHGHGAVYNLLMGSVSQGVLAKARCPVLVVPTRPGSEASSVL